MSNKEVKWTGSRECDFCHKECTSVLYDAMTNMGPWATMCPDCFLIHSYGSLGTGYGQKYKLNNKNEFVKVEG